MKFLFTASMLLRVALALPAEIPRDNSLSQGAQEATVEAANFYTEFGWQGSGKRDVQEGTVEAANSYTEFGWIDGKRDS